MGPVVLLVALAVAVALGVAHGARDGRVRPRPGGSARAGAAADASYDVLRALVPEPGERATLLQFSSAFCAPCRTTRRVLGEVAGLVPGVAHVEVDAESHLEAVRALAVHRTPTTLVLGPDLAVLARARGAPRRDEVLATLAGAVP